MKQPYELRLSDFKKEVLSSSKKPRKEFRRVFSIEVDQFTKCIFDAFEYHRQSVGKWNPNGKRNFWVEKYLQNAIDNLLCSANHFISGYIVASGNLSRQFCESCAMAMIISNPRIKYYERHFVKLDTLFERLEENRSNGTGSYAAIVESIKVEISKIQVNQSIKTVTDNQQNFNINSDAWKSFTRIRNYYHKFSHPSVDLLAKILATPLGTGKVVYGSYYNPEFRGWYKQEMERKIDLAKALKNIIGGIDSQLIDDSKIP